MATKRKPAPKKRNGSDKKKSEKYAQTKGDPFAPKLGDPIILCKKCGVWSARRNYCSHCLKPRPGFTQEGTPKE